MNRFLTIFWLWVLVVSSHAIADAGSVQAMAVTQDAGNLAEKDWTPELLDYQAKYIANQSFEESKRIFIEKGGSPDAHFENSQQSRFEFVDGHKIGVITFRFRIEDQRSGIDVTVASKRFAILRDHNMVSATCFNQGGTAIPVREGICADQIRRTLGIDPAKLSYTTDAPATYMMPNPELRATSAMAYKFGTDMLTYAGLALLATLILRLRNYNKKRVPEYRQGYLAFQNGQGESDNPYLGSEQAKATDWSKGFDDARMIRQGLEKKR